MVDQLARQICPYLRSIEDRKTPRAYPTQENRCFASPEITPITYPHQELFCLDPCFTECPVYRNPQIAEKMAVIGDDDAATSPHQPARTTNLEPGVYDRDVAVDTGRFNPLLIVGLVIVALLAFAGAWLLASSDLLTDTEPEGQAAPPTRTLTAGSSHSFLRTDTPAPDLSATMQATDALQPSPTAIVTAAGAVRTLLANTAIAADRVEVAQVATHTPDPPTRTPTRIPASPIPSSPTPSPAETLLLPSDTPRPSHTATPSPTETPFPSPTDTDIPSPTRTATPAPTDTAIPTDTPAPTQTPILTDTAIPPTRTHTPRPTDAGLPVTTPIMVAETETTQQIRAQLDRLTMDYGLQLLEPGDWLPADPTQQATIASDLSHLLDGLETIAVHLHEYGGAPADVTPATFFRHQIEMATVMLDYSPEMVGRYGAETRLIAQGGQPTAYVIALSTDGMGHPFPVARAFAFILNDQLNGAPRQQYEQTLGGYWQGDRWVPGGDYIGNETLFPGATTSPADDFLDTAGRLLAGELPEQTAPQRYGFMLRNLPLWLFTLRESSGV